MKAHIQFLTAAALGCLVSGCVVAPAPYPDGPVVYGRPAEYGPPVAVAPGEIIMPEVVIVEGGVRHDRYFYERHPEYYHIDRQRYPERFVVATPARREVVVAAPARAVPAMRGPAPAVVVDVNTGHTDKRHEDSKDKKKHHDDHDRDH